MSLDFIVNLMSTSSIADSVTEKKEACVGSERTKLPAGNTPSLKPSEKPVPP